MEAQSYKFYPKDLRDRAVAEAIQPGAIRRDIAKRFNIGDQTIARWLREDYGTAVPGPEELANPIRKTAPTVVASESPSSSPPLETQSVKPDALSNELESARTERDLLKSLLSHYLSRGKL
jgi:transposase-like protein